MGEFFAASSSYQYELNDHLGNVRAVINSGKLSGNVADVVTYTDYYAFGSVARAGGTGYRYGYQGQYAEKDKGDETDWNAFELRMYDARLGRWLSTDPYNQFDSPYTSMGNNPVNGVDPDGGYVSAFSGGGALIGAGIGLAVGTGLGLAIDKDNWEKWAIGFMAGGALVGGFGSSDWAKVNIWKTHEPGTIINGRHQLIPKTYMKTGSHYDSTPLINPEPTTGQDTYYSFNKNDLPSSKYVGLGFAGATYDYSLTIENSNGQGFAFSGGRFVRNDKQRDYFGGSSFGTIAPPGMVPSQIPIPNNIQSGVVRIGNRDFKGAADVTLNVKVTGKRKYHRKGIMGLRKVYIEKLGVKKKK